MKNVDIKMFISKIYRTKGVDLSSYRENFLLRRLNHRMKLTDSENFLDYLDLIERDNAEFNRFLDALAINVSEFFRDAEVFDYFKKTCLREIISRKRLSNNESIRIWSAGCAQGQEAYSLAILLKEELSEENNLSVRIWGIDIDKAILQDAEKAEYDLRSFKGIVKTRIGKYFSRLPDGLFRLNEEIRQMVKFLQCDLINEIPLKYVDVIFCRNVMIYLSQHQQEKLLFRFYKALNQKGYLVIGKVETIWSDSLREIYTPVALKYKIYQKKSTVVEKETK